MKTKNVFKTNYLVLLTVVLLSSFVFFSCSKDNNTTPPVDNRPYNLGGAANGGQMVPAVAATGTGTISGTYNPATRLLTYTSNWDTLSGRPISGGFYLGASGTNGALIGNQWSFDSTATASGSKSDTMTLTADQAAQLITNAWYYSYNTEANPTGEIRGQIITSR